VVAVLVTLKPDSTINVESINLVNPQIRVYVNSDPMHIYAKITKIVLALI